ncbi:uncharacterized protein LOC120258981 isoform X1 [Dioscorea cayenensis subsp. rotundata]|uniref:Uncharacterized protein LOC120258981 isoform X1 n=1 Tax=Dioscorea cayennensis subsp. rotundata TaxID=55577 RepID=A0AB40B5D7_DIOCR|nr:uncharacterized protein LOC120258981 isoform X1 [Dioscorea cayenensis subsp. rotundata]XP_039122425.1 uncharacterized protein LOC120258981 isoform X1 [Dioscorea cayenensis subsp. rotundata]
MSGTVDAQSHATHSGGQSSSHHVQYGTDHLTGISVAKMWNPASVSLVRHQLQEVPPKNDRGDEFRKQFMDEEITELYSRSLSQEEEIHLLRRRIADARANELQLLQEKHILERKLSDLRMVRGEKQRGAASDAYTELTQRRHYIDQNLSMETGIRAAEEDKYIFTSSLLSLLAEYNIQPHELDPSTIVNSVKNLYRDMHWKLRSAEASFASRNNLIGRQAGEIASNINQIPKFSNSQLSHEHMDLNMNDFHRQNHTSGEMRLESSGYQRAVHDPDLSIVKEVKFPPSPDSEFEFSNFKRDVGGATTPGYVDGNVGEAQTRKSAMDAQFQNPAMHERQTSSLSEGEISLPGIEGFQIFGEAKLGSTLKACGYPINGTSLCVFQWFRHLHNGTRQSIDGATVPDYVVTADDVGTLLSVDCIPMDESGRQGDLVSLFANNQLEITCDPDMQVEIDALVSTGRATFSVQLLKDSSEDWEPTMLILKRSSYQIMFKNAEAVIAEEKYSTDQHIKVPLGLSTQFVLIRSDGTSLPFTTNGTQPNSLDNVRLRDMIVLTMRTFQSKALDSKRKSKA